MYSFIDGIKITVAGDSANGDITIRLFDVIAPIHVSRIIQLTRDGLYDGVAFHRVIDGFMAQTGDVQYGHISGDLNYAGVGGSEYPDLEAEFSNIAFNRSIVGMARSSDPDSANSQFFMMLADSPWLNEQYTVIGQVIEGLEVLDSIKRGDPISGAIYGTPDYMAEVQLITSSESTLLSIDPESGGIEYKFVPNLSTIKGASLFAIAENNGTPEFKTLSFDDGINISDAILVLKHFEGITQLTGNAAVAADANQDTELNISDVTAILEHIVWLTPIESAFKVDTQGNVTAANTYESLNGYTLGYYGDVDLSSKIELDEMDVEAPITFEVRSASALGAVLDVYLDTSLIGSTITHLEGYQFKIEPTDGWENFGKVFETDDFTFSDQYEEFFTFEEFGSEVTLDDSGPLTDRYLIHSTLAANGYFLNATALTKAGMATKGVSDAGYPLSGKLKLGSITLDGAPKGSSFEFDATDIVVAGAPNEFSADSVSFTITYENSPPRFESNSEWVSQIANPADSTVVVYNASAVDVDGDTLTYRLSGTDASSLAIDASSGEVTFHSSTDYETKDQYVFTVTASDGALTDTVDVTLDVTDPQDVIYVLFFDNFGYLSASRDDVIFFDYIFDFEDDWEDYYLDSLEPDELDSLPYTEGFGTWRVVDDLVGTYDTYYNENDQLVDSQDYLAGDFIDNDEQWDYFVYGEWDDSIGGRKEYYVNDLDGIDTIPWLQEGLDRGWYLLNYDEFEDLDGATDFYDEADIDPSSKVDLDPVSDFRFFNWEPQTTPIRDEASFQYLSKSEIEALHAAGAGDFTDERFHGDVVLDNFFSELDESIRDRVQVIAVDGWDDHYESQDSVWTNWEIINYGLPLTEVIEDTIGLQTSDISVVSLSYGSTRSEAAFFNSVSDLGPTVVRTLPNNNKYGNRFWDKYLEDDLAEHTEVYLVGGLAEGKTLPEAYDYADLYFDLYDVEGTGKVGTSYAAPKAAAALVNYEASLEQGGSSLTQLTDEAIKTYLNTESIKTQFGFELNGMFLPGTAGNNVLSGQLDDDFLAGLEGDDEISGNQGDDFLLGGLGNDVLLPGIGADVVKGESGSDSVNLSADGVWSGKYVARNVDQETAVGTNQAIGLKGKNKFEDVVDTGADVDEMNLTSGADAFFLDDAFSGLASAITTSEATNNTTARLLNVEIINAGAGDDVVDLTSPIFGLSSFDMTLNGEAGNDILWAAQGDDTLNGGTGNDILNGSSGNDTLTGGSGSDTFEFTATSGNDTITDFAVEDVLKFYRRSSDTNDAVIDEVKDLVTWQADGHVVTIDFVDTDITATNVTIEYELI